MSTILQALQKNSLEQAVTPIPINNQQPQYWKVAVSFALLIIIALLSTLIYLQLHPRTAAQHSLVTTTQAIQPVISVPQAVQPAIPAAPTTATPPTNLVKVTFATQALPEPIPKAPKVAPPKVANTPKTAADQPKQQPIAAPAVQQVVASVEPVQLTDTATPQVSSGTEQDIDYDQVPDELKERFELALLLSDIEDNQQNDKGTSEPEEYGDGSDIRQMSSNFQHKVAPISYEAHMYSSKLEDRWIRINGEVMREGQVDSSGELELLEIQPQRSIFRVHRQSFSLESLSDWKGY